MKNFLSLLLVFSICVIPIYGQSRKNDKLFKDGIKSNDLQKINAALSSGASPDEGLLLAVTNRNADLVEYFVEKGADPANGLINAVYHNETGIVQFLLDKGATFRTVTTYDVVEPTISNSNIGAGIPVTFVKNQWMIKNEKSGQFEDIDEKMKAEWVFKYKTIDIKSGSPAMNFAIRNNNLKIITLLLEHGFNVKDPSIVRYFLDNDPYALAINLIPYPPLIMKPIDYAISIDADPEIIKLLQKYDPNDNYRFTFEKAKVLFENNSDSILEVKSDEYGIFISKKISADDVFGIRLSYSIDNLNFKEVKFLKFPLMASKSEGQYASCIKFYYFNVFGDSIKPKEIILKIDINKYGKYIDPRDGESYRTVKIGEQVLLAENFRYKTAEGCRAFDNDKSNIQKYGYLYTRDTANVIAPPGWHLPSIQEWEELYEYAGGNVRDVKNVLSVGGGSGFDLALGGTHNMLGYSGKGKFDIFWSSSLDKYSYAFYIYSDAVSIGSTVWSHNSQNHPHSTAGASVRLFKNTD